MLVRLHWLLRTTTLSGNVGVPRPSFSFVDGNLEGRRRQLSLEAVPAVKRQPQTVKEERGVLEPPTLQSTALKPLEYVQSPVVFCKEISIPVPWGHIAAKEWGPSTAAATTTTVADEVAVARRRVLAIHGWQDNCGSFDTLIPLLPADLNVVAFDLPGHGHSSPKPPGMPYRYFDWIADCARVVDHLGWKEFNILSHCMGGAVGIAYAACFASSVRKLVSLDLIKPWVFDMEDFHVRVAGVIRQVLGWEARLNQPPKSIDFEAAVSMVVERSYNNSISDRSARILLKRGAATVGNGPKVTFTRDGRLKTPLYQEETNEQFRRLAANVRCDLLVTAVEGGLAWELSPRDELDDFLELYRANARSFRLIEMTGTHHVHMDRPESIAPHITDFFLAD